MCGITGYYSSDRNPEIHSMVQELRHRGPDSKGTYRDRRVGLGSRRLSIVGTENGDQPIHNEDETVWTVFNGEIYNHERLRSKLQEKGHRFYSGTDTEVIVHAYEEWGKDCFSRFKGMYAIAIWDRDEEELLLTRDSIGKKPLYYYNGEKGLIFGSEIKAILSTGFYEPEMNVAAAKQFLAYGYTKAPKTLFDGIKKIKPGEVVVKDDEGVRSTVVRNEFNPINVPDNLDKAADQLHNILKESMRDWTREGGSYSVFLSGGVDSSAILGLLSRIEGVDSLKAYTASFPGSKFDEKDRAEQVAGHFGAEHEVVEMPQNAVKMIPELVNQFDDLMADQACVPYYMLSDRASSYGSVGFTGSGGDELFGGYEHYQIMDRGDRYLKKLPRSARMSLPTVLSKLPYRVLEQFFPYVRELGPKGFERFSKYMNSLDSLPKSYENINAMMTEDEVNKILSRSKDDGGRITEFEETPVHRYIGEGDLRQVIAYEQFHQLPSKNLMKADKTSMAHGLELRTPLLNRQTIKFSTGMSNKLLRGNGGKKVFKRAMESYLPDKIRNQQKQRLLMPIHEWIKDDPWWTIEELSENYGFPPMINESYIAEMIDGLESSPLYYSRQLWNVAHFIVWYDKYL